MQFFWESKKASEHDILWISTFLEKKHQLIPLAATSHVRIYVDTQNGTVALAQICNDSASQRLVARDGPPFKFIKNASQPVLNRQN